MRRCPAGAHHDADTGRCGLWFHAIARAECLTFPQQKASPVPAGKIADAQFRMTPFVEIEISLQRIDATMRVALRFDRSDSEAEVAPVLGLAIYSLFHQDQLRVLPRTQGMD